MSHINTYKLPENIKKLRLLIGEQLGRTDRKGNPKRITQGEFAEMIGDVVGQGQVSAWEEGKNEPHKAAVDKICLLWGIDEETLLHGEIEALGTLGTSRLSASSSGTSPLLSDRIRSVIVEVLRNRDKSDEEEIRYCEERKKQKERDRKETARLLSMLLVEVNALGEVLDIKRRADEIADIITADTFYNEEGTRHATTIKKEGGPPKSNS